MHIVISVIIQRVVYRRKTWRKKRKKKAHCQVGCGTNKSTRRLAHIQSEYTYEVSMQLGKRALPSVFLSHNLDLPWRERAKPWASTTAMDHKDQKLPCRQDNAGIGMNSSSFSLVQSWCFSLGNESDAMYDQLGHSEIMPPSRKSGPALWSSPWAHFSLLFVYFDALSPGEKKAMARQIRPTAMLQANQQIL